MADVRFTAYDDEIKPDIGAYVPEHDTRVARSTPARLSDIVNVKDWGALGDGATDDTDAIQAAIGFANSLGKPVNNVCGGIVFFPPGVYVISKGGTVPLFVNQPGTGTANVTLVGSGRDVTILRGDYNPGGQQEQVNNGFLVQVEIGDHNYHGPLGGGNFICGMRDLTIENTSTGPTSGACINMGAGNNRFFDNCHFIGVTGFACTERSFGLRVSDCLFTCSRPITAASEPAATRSPYYTPSKFLPPIGGDFGTGQITGGVGAYIGQGYFYNLHAVGFDIGFSLIGGGTDMHGCSATQCGIGLTTGIRNGSFSVNVLDAGGRAPNWQALNSGKITSCKFDRCTWGIHAYAPTAVFAANNVTGTTGPNVPATLVSTTGLSWNGGTHVVTATTVDDHNLSGTPVIQIDPVGWTRDPDGFVTITVTGAKTFTYAGPLTTPPAFTTGTWNYPLEVGVNCIAPSGCVFAANSLDASVSIASFDAISFSGSSVQIATAAWATKGKYGWILPWPDGDAFAAGLWSFEMCGGGGPSSLVRPGTLGGTPAVQFPGIPNARFFPGYQGNIPGFSAEGSELNFTKGAPGLTFGDPLYVRLGLTVAANPSDTTLTFASVPSSVISGMDVSTWVTGFPLGTVNGPPSGTVVTLSGTVGRTLPVGSPINFHRLGSTTYKTRFDGTTWRVVAT